MAASDTASYVDDINDPSLSPQEKDKRKAQYWTKEIQQAKKWMQKFHSDAKRIEARYMLRSDADPLTSPLRYNMFWSNVQTMISIVYGRLPEVEVSRSNQDQTDDVARVAANILSRIFNVELKNIENSPYFVYQEAVRDLFIAGLGVAWARYEFASKQVDLPPIMGQDGTEMAPAASTEMITDEFAPLDYVRWSDFLLSPCRRWYDARWVGRRVRMSRDAVKRRFGEKLLGQIPMSKGSRGGLGNEDPLRYGNDTTSDVWELWDKDSRSVCWYVEGMDVTLQSLNDPLGLASFFPVKMPLRATVLPDNFLPKQDYLYLESQYAELNLLGSRLELLSEACRVAGVYDKNNEPVKRLIGQAAMNQMIPVDNWAMFAEKGGVKGTVDWLPLDMIVNAIERLTARKAEVVKDIYEIYGINDVMRGTSLASETATAQRLKTQFGSARLEVRQEQVAQWVTSNTRLRAEIICRHWRPETILKRSQIMQTPDAPLAQQALQLLKSNPDEIVTRITVSAGTIAQPDWQMERQQRVEFLQATSQFIGMCMPLIEKSPGSGQFLIPLLQWAATGFKGADKIESVFDQALASLQQSLTVPKPPPPPTPDDKKNLAGAEKSLADARKAHVDSMKTLVEMGLMPQTLAMVPPPQPPPAPESGPVPGQPPPPNRGMPPPPSGPGGPPVRVPGPNPGGRPLQ
jgi:hypothetical protein